MIWSPERGEGEGAERERSREELEGKEMLSERLGDRQQNRWLREGAGCSRELGWTPGVLGAREPINSHSSFGARKQM